MPLLRGNSTYLIARHLPAHNFGNSSTIRNRSIAKATVYISFLQRSSLIKVKDTPTSSTPSQSSFFVSNISYPAIICWIPLASHLNALVAFKGVNRMPVQAHRIERATTQESALRLPSHLPQFTSGLDQRSCRQSISRKYLRLTAPARSRRYCSFAAVPNWSGAQNHVSEREVNKSRRCGPQAPHRWMDA